MKPASKEYCMTTGYEVFQPLPPGLREITKRREALQATGLTWEQAIAQAYAENKVEREAFFAKRKPQPTVKDLVENFDAFIATHGARRDVPFEQRHWIDTNEPKDAVEDRRRFDESFNE